MKIAALRATPLTARFADLFGGEAAIPAAIARPASHFAAIPRAGQYATLVSVEAEDGAIGHGEAWGLPVPDATALWIERAIAPLVIGRDADDVDGVHALLTGYFARIGHAGSIALEAVSGLDLALWDLRGRRAGRSVGALLGRKREAVDCYVSPIMLEADEASTRAAARAFVDAGFRAVKLKLGRGVDRDLGDARAVRDEIGEDRALLLDVNGAYDLADASRLADGLADLAIHWLEEPLHPAHIADMSALKRRSAIPLAAGENDFTLAQFARLIDDGVDVVMPNVTRAGGITGCRAIAAYAARAGARFSLHGVGAGLMQAASLHVLSALDEPALFEVNRFPNPLRESLTAPPLEPVEGRLRAPSGDGLGVAVQADAVARFGPRP